jgi:hypothetical protein
LRHLKNHIKDNMPRRPFPQKLEKALNTVPLFVVEITFEIKYSLAELIIIFSTIVEHKNDLQIFAANKTCTP